MQVRITDKAVQEMIRRSAKESGRSKPKQVEYLVRVGLNGIGKK